MVSPVGWSSVLLDADTWLHTRIGQIILSSGTVPHQDLFAFSKVAQPWYAFEWLSEVVLAGVYQFSGLKGISLLAAGLITLYFTVLLKHTVWKGSNGMIALITTLVAATGTSIHFHARPHLFTLLFLSTSLWILDNNRRLHTDETKPSGRYILWALVPLTALWANLHGGFFIFFALLGLRVLGCAAESFFYPDLRLARRNEAIQLTLLGLACTAASLLNPYGYHLHEHILETLKSPWILANAREFQSPSFRSEEMYNFMVLLFAGLAIVSSLLRKRNLVDPLSILFLAYCSLTSVRHSTIFLLFAAPIIAIELSAAWDAVAVGRKKSSILAILHDVTKRLTFMMPGTSLFIPLAMITIAFAPGLRWPTQIPEGSVPVKFIEAHADRIAGSRIFTSDQIANYLIFRNYPRQKVFFDSRHNYYGPEIGNDFNAISAGQRKWRELLEKYRFNLVLVELDAPLNALLLAASGWHIVQQDEKYVLFERDQAI